MRSFNADRFDLQYVRLIVAAEIELRQTPNLRNAGLAARREIAARAVDGALKQSKGTP